MNAMEGIDVIAALTHTDLTTAHAEVATIILLLLTRAMVRRVEDLHKQPLKSFV